MTEEISKTGRPERIIDWDRVEKLVKYGCNMKQIAAALSINYDFFSRKFKEKHQMPFVEYESLFSCGGQALIIEKQHEAALQDKNISMLVHLGKVRCGQISEENKSNGNAPITIKVTGDGLGSGINISTTPISNEPDKGTQ